MSFSSKHLLFFVLCIQFCPCPLADIMSAIQQGYYYNCSTTGNYTSNSIYKSNLNTLFSALTSNTNITYGFYNFSYGQDSDKVSLIALCRGDLSLDQCHTCINNKSQVILQDCPNQREAIGWYEKCMIRYSNKSILGDLEYDPNGYLLSPHSVANASEFNQALTPLLDDLKNKAAAGSSVSKYAVGTASYGNMTIYALSQCTPDLSETNCKYCLKSLANRIPDCCEGWDGARILQPSCNLRYETSLFYNPDGAVPSTPSSPSGKKSSNTKTIVIVVIIVVVCVAAIVVLFICFCIFRRARKPVKKLQIENPMEGAESRAFDFATIRAATDNFSDENKIGQGGFGAVYKGRLVNGQDIAVKRLSEGCGQGNPEFMNEVSLLVKLQHRNLVRLLGYCLEGNEKLLIYEFAPNSSLDQFLFDSNKRVCLNWERRHKIIRGIARGLLYLHEDSLLKIIHRDLKASNVLLDAEMNAKIADFGLAKLVAQDQTLDRTSRIVGTYGYMAPEYLLRGHYSVKSDVFSFGVLVLEILSGRRNNSYRNDDGIEDLLNYVWRNWREGSWTKVIDPMLVDGSRDEMMRCMHIGLLCVQKNVANRPTMASVGLMLHTYSSTLPVPSEPAFFLNSSTVSYESSSIPSHCSTNEASITTLYPR